MLLHILVVHGSVAILVNHSLSGINRIAAPSIGAPINSLLGLIDIIYSFGNRSRLKRVPAPGTSSLIGKGQDGRQPYNAIQPRNPPSGFICHEWWSELLQKWPMSVMNQLEMGEALGGMGGSIDSGPVWLGSSATSSPK